MCLTNKVGNNMDVDRLTELADKVIAVTDTEKRYKAVSNLQETIFKDTGSLINDCKKVIDNNTTLRFSDFQNEIYRMWGIYNVPYKCISLLTNNLKDVIEYENDTEEKRAERKQKLKDFAQVVGIELPPKKVIHHMGVKCYTEVIRDVSPDIIYCQHGNYRQYDELHNTFYFILCRKIQQSEAKGDLKELFQKVCLYIALNNEKAIMVDELLLLGIDIEQKNGLQGNMETTNENDLPSELNTEPAKALFQGAIQNRLCDTNYKWLKTKALLAYFADRASEYLNLGKGEYDGKKKISWKPFETLFGIKGLSGARRDYQKTGVLPLGHEDVDNCLNSK